MGNCGGRGKEEEGAAEARWEEEDAARARRKEEEEAAQAKREEEQKAIEAERLEMERRYEAELVDLTIATLAGNVLASMRVHPSWSAEQLLDEVRKVTVVEPGMKIGNVLWHSTDVATVSSLLDLHPPLENGGTLLINKIADIASLVPGRYIHPDNDKGLLMCTDCAARHIDCSLCADKSIADFWQIATGHWRLSEDGERLQVEISSNEFLTLCRLDNGDLRVKGGSIASSWTKYAGQGGYSYSQPIKFTPQIGIVYKRLSDEESAAMEAAGPVKLEDVRREFGKHPNWMRENMYQMLGVKSPGDMWKVAGPV